MAKKKKPTPAHIRNQQARARKVEAGKRQIAIWLDGSLIDLIDEMKGEMSRDDVIEQLIADKTESASSYASPTGKKKAKAKTRGKGGKCHLCGTWRPDAELDHLLRGKARYTQAQCKDFVTCATQRGIVG